MLVFAPRAHAQSKPDCGTQVRKEFVLSVLDPNGNIIDSLRSELISLKVNNSRATIADMVFEGDKHPVDLVLLIDASVSQEKVLPLAQAGAKALITSAGKSAQNRIAVVSFSHKVNNTPLLTSDFTSAIAAIERIKIEKPPGYVGGGVVLTTTRPKGIFPGSTSLWDVVRDTTQTLFAAKPENRRRVMILFSDGVDTASSSKLDRVIEDAQKQDLAVFSIGLSDPDLGADKGALKKLSEQTGGAASFPSNREQLDKTLFEAVQRMSANYVIGYCGEANSRDKLQVEIT